MSSRSKAPMSLSYALPAYNEEDIIDQTITVFLKDLESTRDVFPTFELLVVDDGSTDRTRDIIEGWSKKDSRVRALRHEHNRGVGPAILTALAAARMEWFSTNCADRPFDTRDIGKLAPHFEDSDTVVVSRENRSANTPYRKLTSWVNYQLIRTLLRIPVADCQFVQFYRVSLIQNSGIISRDTMIPPELILRAHRKGARIRECRLPFHPRPGGEAKYGHPKHAAKAVADMLRLRLDFWKEDIVHTFRNRQPGHPS